MFHISRNFPSNDIALDLLTEMAWLGQQSLKKFVNLISKVMPLSKVIYYFFLSSFTFQQLLQGSLSGASPRFIVCAIPNMAE